MRIERYSKIIAGADFLKFENLEAADFDEAQDDDFMERQATGAVITVASDLISQKEEEDMLDEYNVAEEEIKEDQNQVRITERGSEEENRSEQQQAELKQ